MRAEAVAGLEWCTSLAEEIERRLDEIVLLELIPDNFFPSFGNAPDPHLFRALERRGIPVMVHSIALSLASIEPLKRRYVEEVLDVIRAIPTTCGWSDHLCVTERDGSEIGQLTPVPYTDATLDAVTRKVEAIQAAIDLPFAIENIAHPFTIPNPSMSETDFIRRLQARTGCGLLLDLHNLFANSMNFGIDPYEYVAELDLALVDAIHLAGGFYDEHGMLQDGHCARVPEPVWELYAFVVRASGRRIPTIIERTSRNEADGLLPVLEDQRRAQAILDAGARS
jgi:uncharacterized protein (UPF0276 family)